MMAGLEKTLKFCIIQHWKLLSLAVIYGAIYVIFLGFALDEGFSRALLYLQFVFVMYAAIFQMSYIKSQASLMIMFGDLRKNVNLGRHLGTVLFAIEGGIVAVVGKIIDGNVAGFTTSILVIMVAIVGAAGLGMITGFFGHMFGDKGYIAWLLAIFIFGALGGMLVGVKLVEFSMPLTMVLVVLAVVIYTIGTVLTGKIIKNMDVRI